MYIYCLVYSFYWIGLKEMDIIFKLVNRVYDLFIFEVLVYLIVQYRFRFMEQEDFNIMNIWLIIFMSFVLLFY